MELSDIGDYPHGERKRHYLMSMTGKTGASPDLTMEDLNLAEEMATADMLNEIHFMLRTLLKVKDV